MILFTVLWKVHIQNRYFINIFHNMDEGYKKNIVKKQDIVYCEKTRYSIIVKYIDEMLIYS